MIRRAAIATTMLLGVASAGFAHDFWVVPTAFAIGTGEIVELRGQTGTRFPQSLSAVATERVADARILAASGDERMVDFSINGKSLFIKHRPKTAGQRVIALSLVPRVSPQSGAGFERYLRLEGAEAVADHYQHQGRLPRDSIRMRVTKMAKTFVEVGNGGPRAFTRLAGHQLEIVPVSDVAGAGAGASVPFRIVFGGQPLANALVVAGSASFDASLEAPAAEPGAAPPAADHPQETRLTADAAGVVTLPLNAHGLWNVRVIHAAPSAAGSGADWDVYFATLVFGAGASAGGVPRMPSSSSDSAAVADVVTAYHRALATGDSARALGLLDPDVVILESGGEERLADYRSHHLAADMEYAKAVRTASAPIRVSVRGDAAWTSSTNTSTGTFRGREQNSAGAELMVLVRTAAGWRITAIHWSSRARRSP